MNYFRLIYKNTQEISTCKKCKKICNYFISRFPKKKNEPILCSYNSIITNTVYLNIKTTTDIIRTTKCDACLYKYNIDSNIYKLIII